MRTLKYLAPFYGALMVLTVASEMQASGGKAEWGYEGSKGPANWGTLSPDYSTCKDGRMQSPIDLAAANLNARVKVDFDYKPVPLTVLNNGHTVQFNVKNGSKLSASGVDFELLQVHFHTPSEHVMSGKTYPLEAHFVHATGDGRLAVVGVFFVEGKANKALETLFKRIPETKTPATTYADITIDPNQLLPKRRGMYRYMGSLTTPPCSEAVNWHVMKRTKTASKEQLERLAKILGNNARPAQSPFSRLIVGPNR